MKHIFLNLKRFDVPVCYGGVNRIAPMGEWGGYIVKNTPPRWSSSSTCRRPIF